MNALFVGFLGTTELIIILVIVVLIFGVGKLPEVGRQLGQGIKNFKGELGTEGKNEALPPEQPEQTVEPRDVTSEHRR